MSQDTNVSNLIINKLTKAQFEGIENPDPTQLYLTTDELITSEDVTDALGYTPLEEVPIASDEQLGGIKVGEGLSITEDGVLSAEGGGSGSDTLGSLGQVVTSSIPLEDARLYPLNGSLISGEGEYKDYIDYLKSKMTGAEPGPGPGPSPEDPTLNKGYLALSWMPPMSGNVSIGSSDYTYCIGYDGTKYIVITSSGIVGTSTDGVDWTKASATAGLAYGWQTIAYNGTDKYVSGNYQGYITTSTNGTTWTNAAQNATLGENNWRSIIWDGTKFINVGRDGHISTSTDGDTWTTPVQNANLATYDNWARMAYNGTTYVLLGRGGRISTSEDLETWTTPITVDNLYSSYAWTEIAYDGVRFVALCGEGYTSTSIDGIHWSNYVSTFTTSYYSDSLTWNDLIYTGEKFVALANRGYLIFSAKTPLRGIPDLGWSISENNTSLGSHSWRRIFNNGSSAIAIGSTGYMSTSTNGTTWTSASEVSNLGDHGWSDIAFNGTNKYIIVGSQGYYSTSTDGSSWNYAYTINGFENMDFTSICYDGTKFLAITNNGSYTTSTDGSTWSEYDYSKSIGGTSSYEYGWVKVIYADSKYIALGADGSVSISTDGTTWNYTNQALTLGAQGWRDLIYDGTNFIAISASGYTSISEDGETWTPAIQNKNLGNDAPWVSICKISNKIVTLAADGNLSEASKEPAYEFAITPASDAPTVVADWKRIVPTQNGSGNPNSWYDVIYGKGKFVAIGDSSYYAVSTSGMFTGWVNQDSTLGYSDYCGIAFDGTKFLILERTGYQARISTSTSGDFSSWSTPSTPSGLDKNFNGDWRFVRYVNGNFISFNDAGTQAVSSDGTTWTTTYFASLNKSWIDIIYDGTNYILISQDGYISTSTDLETWTTPTQEVNLGVITTVSPDQWNPHHWVRVAYDGTTYYILGSGGEYSSSTDGTTWAALQTSNDLKDKTSWGAFTYGDGKFVALGYDASAISFDYSEYPAPEPEPDPDDPNLNKCYMNFEWLSPFTGPGYSSSSDYTYAMGYGNSTYVVISTTGSVSTSTDGKNWTSQGTKNTLAYTWRGIAYGNSKFVAVAYNGYISTSTDGATWADASQTSWSSGNWVDIVWDGSKFVCLNKTGYISTSTDGTTWTTDTQDSNLSTYNDWYRLNYNGKQFMALGTGGYISTSTDLTTWTIPVEVTALSSVSSGWVGLAYDGVQYIATSQGGSTLVSFDGIHWSAASTILTSEGYSSYTWFPIVYANGNLAALSSKGDICLSSKTPIRILPSMGWSVSAASTELGNNTWKRVLDKAGTLVALSSTGYVSTSTNGTTWTTATENANLGNNSWVDVAYDGTKLVAMGATGYFSTSTDGVNWTYPSREYNFQSYTMAAICYDGTKFIALESSSGYMATSTNGTSWSALDTSSYLGYGANWVSLKYGNSKYVALNSNGTVAVSTDGSTWRSYYNYDTIGSFGDWTDLIYDGTNFIAVGASGKTAISEDGITWTPRFNNTNLRNSASWNTICPVGDFLVAVSGDGYVSKSSVEAEYAFATDPSDALPATGTSWKVTASSMPNNSSYDFVMYDERSNYFRAITASGFITGSPDGYSWDYGGSNSELGYNYWTGMAFNGTDLYIALGKYGYTSTATTGYNWTSAISSIYDSFGGWSSIIYDGTQFVALGSNEIATTTDDTTWTRTTLGLSAQYWRTILYVDSTYYIFNSNGYISTSTDLTTWTTPVQDVNLSGIAALDYEGWRNFSYDGSNFIAISSSGKYSTSTDGLTWSAISDADGLAGSSWSGLTYGNNRYVTLGSKAAVSMNYSDMYPTPVTPPEPEPDPIPEHPTNPYYTTEEEWQEAVTTSGVCGKYVFNKEDDTIRVPRYGNQLWSGDGSAPVVNDEVDLNEVTSAVDVYYYIIVATSVPESATADIDQISADLAVQAGQISGLHSDVVSVGNQITALNGQVTTLDTQVSSKAGTSLANITNAGKILISNMAMPSSSYETLIIGADGTSYQAPSNGWVWFKGRNNVSDGQIWLGSSDGYSVSVRSKEMYTNSLMLPVRKSSYFSISYDGNLTDTPELRFYYAVGSESEAN